MADSDADTSRTVVKTYVPVYQREEWDAHADQLDMSRSEFVRTMVQAGRRGYRGEQPPVEDESTSQDDSDSTDSNTEAAGVPDLESTVLSCLSVDAYTSWEELLGAVTDDIEGQLEETLQELQATDDVRYSGRHGGYTLEG